MPVLFTNNASATLSAAITTGATSITLTTGQGALFPAISGSNFFYATLTNSSNVLEIVKVTARASDTLTVVRAQEGTTATAYAIGDKLELRVTAAGLTNMAQLDATQTFSGTNTISGTLTSSGGTFSGSWAGTPTFSGTVTFSGTLTSSGGTLSGTWAGAPTFSGSPTFSGNPAFSGTVSGGVTSGGAAAGWFFQDRVTSANQWGWYSTSNIVRLYKNFSGTTADVVTIDASGNFTAGGNVTAYSDESLKQNWRELDALFLRDLASVKAGIYDRKDTGETQVGVSAQSLQQVLPQAVQKDSAGLLSVAYGNAALAACVVLARKLVALEEKLGA